MPGFSGGGGSSGGGGGGAGGGGGDGSGGAKNFDLSPVFTSNEPADAWENPKNQGRILGLTNWSKEIWKQLSKEDQKVLKHAAKAAYLRSEVLKIAKGKEKPRDNRAVFQQAGGDKKLAEAYLDYNEKGRLPTVTGLDLLSPALRNLGVGFSWAEQNGEGNVDDILNDVITRSDVGGGIAGKVSPILADILSGVFGVGNGGGGQGGGGSVTTKSSNDNDFNWGDAASIAGDLIGAGSSIYGSQVAAKKAKLDIGSQLASGYDPAADPLLALLNAQGQAGLGFGPDPNILGAASPLNRLENNLLNSLGGDIRWKEVGGLQTAIRALQNGASGEDVAQLLVDSAQGKKSKKVVQRAFLTALTSGGYSSVGDLMAAENAYQTQARSVTEQLRLTGEGRATARGAANQSIDQILSNYPTYDASNIESESMLALQPYYAQELEQANQLGYNPATNIALTRTNGIRDALSILSGRQGLANTALAGLGGELGRQTSEGLATSGHSQAARFNAANLASQQAMAINGLRQQSNIYQGTALGGGIAAAGAQVANGLGTWSDNAAWQQILDRIGEQKQPGTQIRNPGAQDPWTIA